MKTNKKMKTTNEKKIKNLRNSPELPQWTWPARGRLPAVAGAPWWKATERRRYTGSKYLRHTGEKFTWHWGSLPRPAWLVCWRSGLKLSLGGSRRLTGAPPWRWPPPSKHYHLSDTWGGIQSNVHCWWEAAPLPGKCQMLIDFWLGVHTIIIRREENEWGYIWMTFARVQSSLMQLKEQLWFDLHTFICLFAWLLFSSWFVCLFVSLLAC